MLGLIELLGLLRNADAACVRDFPWRRRRFLFGFSGGPIPDVTADHGTWVQGAFTVGSGSGAKAPVIFENESCWLDVSVGGNGDAGCGDNTNVSVNGTVLLSNDVARLGLAYRHRSGPAGNPDKWVGPFVGAGVARNEAKVSGDARTGMAGGDDPVGDGLITFVAAGTIPAIPFGGFVACVADVADGYFSERTRRRLPVRRQKKD